MRPVRIYTVLGPDTVTLPKVVPFVGREVEIVIRPVPTLEEVRAANAGITDMAETVIADREDRF